MSKDDRITNCPNCGAPVESTKCPYCGTIIYDFVNLDITGKTPTWLRIKSHGKNIITKAYVKYFREEYEPNVIECCTLDSTLSSVILSKPDITLSIEFAVVPDEKGVMATYIDKEMGHYKMTQKEQSERR